MKVDINTCDQGERYGGRPIVTVETILHTPEGAFFLMSIANPQVTQCDWFKGYMSKRIHEQYNRRKLKDLN